MLFKKLEYQLIIRKQTSLIPQFGDCPFTISCYVYLKGKQAFSLKWVDGQERSRFRLDFQLQELDGLEDPEGKAATPPRLIEGLEGQTTMFGMYSKVTADGGLRFDRDGLYILPKINKGTFRIHVTLSRAHFNPLRSSEYEVLAEADSENFTRGDEEKHKLPDGWEIFQGCGGFR